MKVNYWCENRNKINRLDYSILDTKTGLRRINRANKARLKVELRKSFDEAIKKLDTFVSEKSDRERIIRGLASLSGKKENTIVKLLKSANNNERRFSFDLGEFGELCIRVFECTPQQFLLGDYRKARASKKVSLFIKEYQKLHTDDKAAVERRLKQIETVYPFPFVRGLAAAGNLVRERLNEWYDDYNINVNAPIYSLREEEKNGFRAFRNNESENGDPSTTIYSITSISIVLDISVDYLLLKDYSVLGIEYEEKPNVWKVATPKENEIVSLFLRLDSSDQERLLYDMIFHQI